MSNTHTEQVFDLFVIGGGSGGVRAARIAAGLGAKVGLCEEREMGGTCVNVGCVPKKLLVYGAGYGEAMAEARRYGWSVEVGGHDWGALIEAKDREIGRLNGIYNKLLVDAGVEVFVGKGALAGPDAVEIGERVVKAKRILIATGGWPVVPLVPGRELAITSNEVFGLKQRPKRIVIVGGGYIGVEFAGIFKGLGSEVTLVHRPGGLLRGFDEDVRAAVAEGMAANGVTLVESEEVRRIEEVEGGVRRLSLSCGRVLEGEAVLFATGRAPMTRGLGLEAAGVTLDRRGAVVINARFQSTAPTVYAVGDVCNRNNLTPVALAEGMWLARHLFGGEDAPLEERLIPTAVFSKPQVATVGMTEAQARAAHPNIAIYMSKFRTLKDTITQSSARTLMKLVVDRETDQVLGCHMVGPDAAEIVQGFAVALGCGVTKRQLDATLGIHPTAAEEFVTMRQPVR